MAIKILFFAAFFLGVVGCSKAPSGEQDKSTPSARKPSLSAVVDSFVSNNSGNMACRPTATALGDIMNTSMPENLKAQQIEQQLAMAVRMGCRVN